MEVNSEEFGVVIEISKGLLAGTDCHSNFVVSLMELYCSDFLTTLIFKILSVGVFCCHLVNLSILNDLSNRQKIHSSACHGECLMLYDK